MKSLPTNTKMKNKVWYRFQKLNRIEGYRIRKTCKDVSMNEGNSVDVLPC